ncbi:MAG: hypothetical protein AAF721_04480 [Myxococcota bacterium]
MIAPLGCALVFAGCTQTPPTTEVPALSEAERRDADDAPQAPDRADGSPQRGAAAPEKAADLVDAGNPVAPEPEPRTTEELPPALGTFYLLLRTTRIRKLPYAKAARSMLHSLPDFDFLVRSGGLDPLDDFDHIVIASPNITNALDTFYAAEYTGSRKRIRKAIERAVATEGEVIEWTDKGGFMRGNPRPSDPKQEDSDSRWFVFQRDQKVVMLVREAFVGHIVAGAASNAGGASTPGQFVSTIADLGKFAAERPRLGLQAQVTGIRSVLRRPELPFSTPDLVEISVEPADDHITIVKLGFAAAPDATGFKRWYETELAQELDKQQLRPVIKPIYDQVALSRDGETITLRTDLTEPQIVFVLDRLAASVSPASAGKRPE